MRGHWEWLQTCSYLAYTLQRAAGPDPQERPHILIYHIWNIIHIYVYGSYMHMYMSHAYTSHTIWIIYIYMHISHIMIHPYHTYHAYICIYHMHIHHMSYISHTYRNMFREKKEKKREKDRERQREREKRKDANLDEFFATSCKRWASGRAHILKYISISQVYKYT